MSRNYRKLAQTISHIYVEYHRPLLTAQLNHSCPSATLSSVNEAPRRINPKILKVSDLLTDAKMDKALRTVKNLIMKTKKVK